MTELELLQQIADDVSTIKIILSMIGVALLGHSLLRY